MSIIWKNGQSPAINQSNLRANQQMLEENADVLNVFEAMTDIATETTRDYPNDYYLISKQQINPINSALRMRGVTPSEVFKNIPDEILSIRGEGEEQLGAIEVDIVRNFEVIETENIEVNTNGIPHWHYQRTQFVFQNNAGTTDDDVHEVYIGGQRFYEGVRTETSKYYMSDSVWGPQPSSGVPEKIFEVKTVYEVRYNAQGTPWQYIAITREAFGNALAQELGFTKTYDDITHFYAFVENNVIINDHPAPNGEDISLIEAIKMVVQEGRPYGVIPTLKQGYALRTWGMDSHGNAGIIAQLEARDGDIVGFSDSIMGTLAKGGLGGAASPTNGQWIEWFKFDEVL